MPGGQNNKKKSENKKKIKTKKRERRVKNTEGKIRQKQRE